MDTLRKLTRPLPQKWRNRLLAWQLKSLAAWKDKFRSPEIHESAEITLDCRFCGSTASAHRELGNVPLTHPGPFQHRDYRLLHCLNCDVVYLDPEPNANDLETLYQGSAQFTDATYSSDKAVARMLDTYGRRLDQLGIVPQAGQSLLEVGAGMAWVSRACKQRNAGIHTVAQDVSAECAASCPWTDEYILGTIHDVPVSARFALVSMTHVIEHLTDPAWMLAELSQRTLPDGHIYVTGPYRPPLWQPRDGFRPWLHYSYLHVPAHIAYLSENWFRRTAKNVGLELVRWDNSHDGHQVYEALLRKPKTE